MCKWPYLAIPQLCREMLQPLKVFVSISSNAFLSILGNCSPLVLGKRLSQPYFCLIFLGLCPKNRPWHTQDNIFPWGPCEAPQGHGILCISPSSVTGMLWSPNIVITPVLSHLSISSLLSGKDASIKMCLFQAQEAPGRQVCLQSESFSWALPASSPVPQAGYMPACTTTVITQHTGQEWVQLPLQRRAIA